MIHGRWLAALAAVRAVEHLVLGGVFTAILLEELTGTGLKIDPVMRAILSIF